MSDEHHPVAIDHARERSGWPPLRRLPEDMPEMIRLLEDGEAAWHEENGMDPPAGADLNEGRG